jgi:hypothetical protein
MAGGIVSDDFNIFMADLDNAKTKDAAERALLEFEATTPSEDESYIATAHYTRWLYIYRNGEDETTDPDNWQPYGNGESA